MCPRPTGSVWPSCSSRRTSHSDGGFGNGGGFVQAQTVVQADEFVSTNFSNANETGFDLNSGSTTDNFGTPANTIQVYTGFFIGPPTSNHISFVWNGSQATTLYYSGDAAETFPGEVRANDTVPGQPTLNIAPPRLANGRSFLSMESAQATTPATMFFGTAGETTPTGWDVTGYALFGDVPSGDLWTVDIENTNSVVHKDPGLVIGDNSTPGARLRVSQNELFAINGAGTPQTLFLNERNDEGAAGSVANLLMRARSAVVAGPVTPGTSFAAQATLTNVTCPASGVLAITLKFTVTGNTALVAGSFIAGCPNVANVTQSTTPFAATAARSAQANGTWLGGAGGASNLVTLSTTVVATGLGAAGDNLTVTGQFEQASASGTNSFQVSKIELSVVPSL